MRSTTTYFAKDGKVYARTPEGVREVTTSLGNRGRDLERFERALNTAREQRPGNRIDPRDVHAGPAT